MSDHNHSKAHKRDSASDLPSANALQSYAADLTGEDHEPTGPNMVILQLITMIRKADTGVADSWSPLVQRELVHIKAALRLIQTNPLFSFKYGGSLGAAMELVGILKARAATLELNSQIDPALTEISKGLRTKHFAAVSGLFVHPIGSGGGAQSEAERKAQDA